jgi:hypothetical protein
MKARLYALLATALCFIALPAQAAIFHFTGHITNHNDVVLIPFTLDEDADEFRLWTDSFLDGVNFDPIATLWADDGGLIGWNDDDASLSPATQSYGDAGLYLSSLVAGNYILTLTLSENYALGSVLSDGFRYDGETPVLLNDYSFVPTGGDWSVWLTATQAGNGSVPEPSLPALLALGTLAACIVRRHKRASR